MSYRENEIPPDPTCDVPTLTELHVLNGTVAKFRIPCSYFDEDTQETVDIDLVAEGYANPTVAIDTTVTGLTFDVEIDAEEPNVLNLDVSAMCQAAVTEDIVCGISVLVTRTADGNTDAALRANLLIAAGPIAGYVPPAPTVPTYTVIDGGLPDPGQGGGGGTVSASEVATSTSSFNGHLSGADVTVQQALNKLDDHTHSGYAAAAHNHQYADVNHSHAAGGGSVSLPAGMIAPYAGSAAASGWLLCNGAEVSRSTYATLFAAIGTNYGTGDGSTTFNLPDLRSRVPVGMESGDPNFEHLGHAGGESAHALITSEMPGHQHNYQARTGYLANVVTSADTNNDNIWYGSTGSLLTTAEGGGAGHNNLQPYLVVNYIIKT